MATFHNVCRGSAFGLIGIARTLPVAPKSTRLPTTRHSFRNLERTKWRSFTTTKNGPPKEESMTMWQRFLAPKPMPERHTFAWYREMLLICTVFAITGSSTMMVRIEYCFIQFFLHPSYPGPQAFIVSFRIGCSASREQRPRNQRFPQRRPVVISNLFTCYHDASVRCTFGVCGDCVWSSCLLSAFRCKDLQSIY